MDEDSVSAYVDHAQATIEAAPQMDEANTKAAVLRDFLDLLNWTIPENTQLEYSVKAFGKTYKADYALILEGTPVAFLEAKGVDTSLTEKHRKQLKAYLKNEDVNLGILTNGREYEFYRREIIDSKVNVDTLGKTDLQSLPDKMTTLSAFSKDAIQNEEWVTILDRIRELREARTKLEVEKDNLATEVAELFTERVSEKLASPAESQAKEMVDRLIQDIESEIDDDGGAGSPEPGNQPDPLIDRGAGDSKDVYRIQFTDGETVLAEFENTQQANVFLEAVQHLIRDHDLISKFESFPYIPGRTRPIINDQTSANGKDMKQPRELARGYYLETNLSSTQKQRELTRLVERCGLVVEFEGTW
jgi:predicted type IV restriction endonuclease